jgi:type I restriction-modification system DNA methylase subunit
MLDTVTRRRIDTARDILVGKVPDPKSQVEQITIALIYKFMDDMDAEAEELGGRRTFFAGDFARYGWAKLMRSGLGGHETLNVYAEAIARMPENPGIPPLFRDIFKNAYLPYRDPETLRAFLKVIDEFDYDHSERLGDAFEYLLSVLGSQGDAGQFRTPRHIIDFIVAMVDPKKGDTILDPACGTAGFLISAWKHVRAANRDTAGNSTLTPDDEERIARSMKGYDISPDMVRLSLVNMYLHGFSDPHIMEYDTLTSEDRWSEFADVILANPPFMTPRGGIKPHTRFSINSRRSEVLFLDYFLEHLTPEGRAGVIVPEGIHFVNQVGHKTVRESLVDRDYLLADITLPHGVFKPYASVKTHILVIDRKLAKRSDSVLFVEVENDGFTQSDTRLPVQGSQLPAALSAVNGFKASVRKGETWRASAGVRAYPVLKSELRRNRHRHILGRWNDLPNRVVHRSGLQLRRIGDLCEIREGLSPAMATEPGDYPLVVSAAERKSAEEWNFEGPAVCLPIVSSAGHGKADIKRVHYQEGRFALATTMCGLFVREESSLLPRFLHIFLENAKNDVLVPLMCGATNVTLDSAQLREVLIPVPSLEEQDEVIESYFVENTVKEIARQAEFLRQASSKDRIQALAGHVIEEARQLAAVQEPMLSIRDFLPVDRANNGETSRRSPQFKRTMEPSALSA